MTIDITYIKAVLRLSSKHKFSWARIFSVGLANLFIELQKHYNQTFFVHTHSKILKKLKDKEKKGEIEIISCDNTGEKYLWHTLHLPFQKLKFYNVTFKINPLYTDKNGNT